MTREEAIKELQEDKALYMPEEWIEALDRDTPDGRLITALDMAIKALEQEPCDKYIKEIDHLRKYISKLETQIVEQEPSGDLISREWLKTAIHNFYYGLKHTPTEEDIQAYIDVAPSVKQEPKSETVTEFADRCRECGAKYGKLLKQEPNAGHCKDCKYFEYDSVAKVDGVPLIVAHEICKRWGDGCKTKEDGYCFLYEPQERNDKE